MNTNQLYLQKTGDDGFIEETGTLISATGGNVGIGTDSPAFNLDFGDDSSSEQLIRLRRGSGDTNQWCELGYRSITTRSNNNLADAQTPFFIDQKGADGTRRVITVNADGYVGIGTSASDGLLQTQPSSGVNGIYGLHISNSLGYSLGGLFINTDNNADLYIKDSEANAQALISSSGISYFKGGDVGIGTTNPLGRLHVLCAAGGGNDALVKIETPSSNAAMAVFQVQNPSGSLLRVNQGGKVGIGTNSPISNLHIAGDSADLYITNDSGDYTAVLGSTASHEGSLALYNSGAVNILFRSESGAASYINNNGNVGIGTISPDALLNVEGSGSDTDWTNISNLAGTAPSILITNTTNTANTFSAMQMIANEGSNNQSFAIVNQATTAGAGDRGSYSPKVHFAQRTASNTFTAAVTIDEDANVGIGTDSPEVELHVKSASTDSVIKIEGATQSLRVDQNSIRGLTSNDLSFYTSGNVGQLYLTSDGNVGIGTTTPSGKLEIGGSGEGIVLTSPAGNKYLVTVGNGGALETQVL